MDITTHKGTLRPLLRLAIPVLFEQLLLMLVGFVDLWLTGVYLSESHLAAIGLMSYLLWFLPCLFGPVGIGALALIARLIGAKQRSQASRVANQAVLLGLGMALLITLLLLLFSDTFVSWCRLPEGPSRLASEYLRILIPIIALMMLQQVGVACLRGAGDMMTVFVSMALVNIVNAGVGMCLVTGAFGLPQMGWKGLAVGTAAGYLLGGLVVGGLLCRGKAGLRLRLGQMWPDLRLLGRIMRIGLAGGADVILIVCCHLWFLSIINALGTAAAAAHSVGLRIESLAYLPGTAFQVAAATLAGQFLGARDKRRASRSVLLALLIGGGLMCLAGLFFFLLAQPLTLVFLGPETQNASMLASSLLRIVSFAMPSLAITMILTGGLRGAGDTAWPLLFTIVGYVGVRIPLANWLAWDELSLPLLGTVAGCGWGVVGAWYAMIADVVLRSVLVSWRFLQGGWRRIEV